MFVELLQSIGCDQARSDIVRLVSRTERRLCKRESDFADCREREQLCTSLQQRPAVQAMAIEDAITNDPAIERHGSEAAA